MKEKKKVYTLRITEKELLNPKIKKALLTIMETRLDLNKHSNYITISTAEYNFITSHWSWASVKRYAPKKKDQLRGEVGKYKGKRCVIRGAK